MQRYRLIRRASAPPIEPTDEQRAVIEHRRGRLRVLAGPGTGKTATIVEAVADRIKRRDIAPQSILVLTYSRRAAAELTERIAGRVNITTTEPMVRTLHSYAYALLRSSAAATGSPAPSLLPAGQADLMVREILTGHADAGGAYWPPAFHAALRVPAFAAELRELMLRTAERHLTPKRMAALGQRYDRPEWVAAARFIDEYRDIADLRQGTTRRGAKLDQAELIAAALEALADPAVLAVQRERVRRIFVDEFQDVDPAQAALIETISAGADELVVVGDPDQSIYAFRGAAPGVLERIEVDDTVALSVCRRLPVTLLEATRRVASAIPGTRTHRDLRAPAGQVPGQVDARVFSTARQEAAYVADQLRRAHVEDDIPWSDMAVLLRSRTNGSRIFSGALAEVGVPVADDALRPLASEPVVAAMLAVLRAGAEPGSFDGQAAMDLLASPLGGMDVLAIRRLRRAVRRATGAGAPVAAPSPPQVAGEGEGVQFTSADAIARLLLGELPSPPDLAADLSEPLARLRNLIALATEGRGEPGAESVLWQIWQATGVQERLLEQSARGGYGGARADADLDSVIELFQRASELAKELPFPGIGGLLGLLADEQVTGARRTTPENAVTIVSAHGSKGLEWDVVAVAGVQEELWPDLRVRTGLLRQEALLDAADGATTALPAAGRLADERRLFYVAATRARKKLIVTAVDSAESTPSRFLPELMGLETLEHGWPSAQQGRRSRALNLPALVADLRRAVCAHDGEGAAIDDGAPHSGPVENATFGGSDADQDEGVVASSRRDDPPESGRGSAAGSRRMRRDRAARLLGLLASAGVRGAGPGQWYGLAPLTTESSLVVAGDPVPLSPSQIESAQECALRTALERNGGRAERQQPQLLGIAVHALAEGLAVGATSADIDLAVDEFLGGQTHLAPWERARLQRRMTRMRTALEGWIAETGSLRTLVGSELAIDLTVPASTPDEVALRLRGRIDWLARDPEGRVIVTDFKTGSTKPTIAEAEAHPQLATYQLALALGALAETFDGETPRPGGAELVYLASGRPELRRQGPQSEQTREAWLGTLRDVAVGTVGPRFVARQGEYCGRCPVRSSCPVQPEGRQVTT